MHDRAKVMEGLTVFEAKSVRTGEKRKREDRGDPSDVDGYKGPWREYVGQVKVSKPTEEEMAAMELMFADKKKKKEKKKDEEEQTMEESSMLHGVYLSLCVVPVVFVLCCRTLCDFYRGKLMGRPAFIDSTQNNLKAKSR